MEAPSLSRWPVFHIAICDQLEDPKLTKKLVKRGITELVTPGVSINDNILNHKENNFLASIHFQKNSCGIAFLDISTGEFLTAEGTIDYIDKFSDEFKNAAELLLKASCLSTNIDFNEYLRLQSQAFLKADPMLDAYADKKWATLQDTPFNRSFSKSDRLHQSK